MKLRWPTSRSSKKNNAASQNSSSFEKDAIVIQSFVRGALCRTRVDRMVKKLIDDILSKRKNAAISSRKIEDDDDSSINVIYDEHNNNNNNNKMDGSSSSIDVLDITLPNNIKDSSKKEEANEVMQESVSDILSKIESNSPKSTKPPTRNWSPVKKSDEPKINNNQKFPTSSPPIIDPTQTDTQKKISFKDANFQSNASKRQTTSEKFLQEHEIRMNDEIQQLFTDIKRIGESGEPYVAFGELFDDEEVANYYEALVGTLKAAKKKKLIEYEGQFLLKGFTDNVIISII